MKIFDLSLAVLSDVLDNDEYFNEALRKIFQKNVELRPLRKDVAILVGCELRHHLLFEYLLHDIKNEFTTNEVRATEVALSNNYFVDLIDEKEVNKRLLQYLGEEKYLKVLPILNNAKNYESYIPKSVSRTSNRYLSLRFNTPEWVLKIWQSFGYGSTYKILKNYSRPPITHIRFSDQVENPNEFLKKNKNFKRTTIPSLYRYYGRELRSINEYKNRQIYQIRPGIKYLIDNYKTQNTKSLLIYNGNQDDSIFREVVESYKNDTKIFISVPNLKEHTNITSFVKKQNIKNVVFEETDKITLGEKTIPVVDVAFVYPKSTNFDLIPYFPDYLMHFKKGKMMKDMYDEEINMLESCSSKVKEGGLLIYVVMTISKKEGSYNILNFLANHKEFKIVKEEQRFPFDELSTGMYYCVLKKITDNKIDQAVLNNMKIECLSSSTTSLKGQKNNDRN